jgi:recombination protein RecT
MNDITKTTDAPTTSPILAFKKDLRSLVERNELVLPANVSIEAFQNAAIVAVQDNPKILRCDQSSVFRSIRRLAASGLVPDGREAALVPFKTRVNGKYVDVCQAMPMVFGLIKVARNSGEVEDIRAHIVYQKEVDEGFFDYVVGDEEKLTHKPILFGDRGDPVAVYAVAVLRNGSRIRQLLTKDEVERMRASSANQRIYEKGQKPRFSKEPIGIWSDWWDEMWKKSAIRRLSKRLPLSSEDLNRIQASDEIEEKIRDITPEDRPESPSERMNRLRENGGDDQANEDVDAHSDVLDGEIVDDEFQTFYNEGMAAYDNFGPDAVCPSNYEEGSVQYRGWQAGFAQAQKQDDEDAQGG